MAQGPRGPAPESTVGRIRALEREVGRPGTRRDYSHSQLVAAAELVMQGVPEDEAMARVGPPSEVLEPGELSHAELVAAAAEAFNRRPPERSDLIWTPGQPWARPADE